MCWNTAECRHLALVFQWSVVHTLCVGTACTSLHIVCDSVLLLSVGHQATRPGADHSSPLACVHMPPPAMNMKPPDAIVPDQKVQTKAAWHATEFQHWSGSATFPCLGNHAVSICLWSPQQWSQATCSALQIAKSLLTPVCAVSRRPSNHSQQQWWCSSRT